MINGNDLIVELEAIIHKIVNVEMPQVSETLVKLLQSTRARALMDVVEAINNLQNKDGK